MAVVSAPFLQVMLTVGYPSGTEVVPLIKSLSPFLRYEVEATGSSIVRPGATFFALKRMKNSFPSKDGTILLPSISSPSTPIT